MHKSFIRRLCEVLRVHKSIAIPQDEFEKFWNARCWLALRQEIAARLDHYHGVLLSPVAEERHIYESRGAIGALSWLLEAREQMQGRIAGNAQKVVDAWPAEQRLRGILELMEQEMRHGSARTGSTRTKGRPARNAGDTGDGRDTDPTIQLAID